jgi:hypothetical protein
MNPAEQQIRNYEQLTKRPACIFRSQYQGVDTPRQAAIRLTAWVSYEELQQWAEDSHRNNFGDTALYQQLDGSRGKLVDFILSTYL